MVRFVLHTNENDVEGLVLTGWSMGRRPVS